MAILGWIICLVIAVFLSGLTIILSYSSSALSGRLSGEIVFPLMICLLFWWIVFSTVPFTMSLN